jgi:chaperonin GroEL
MATDAANLRAVLDEPYILLTDHKITDTAAITHLTEEVSRTGHPLLIVADEIAPDVIAALMVLRRQGRGVAVAINSPEFGQWRKAMLEDIAILTGGRVIARDLGGRLDMITPDDLGTADQVRITPHETVLLRGHGDAEQIRARRAQVQRQLDIAPPNIERDKLTARLARLTGGTAMILAGGTTPVEQKRLAQLLDDALNAARAARAEGVVAGGGTALAQAAPALDRLAEGTGGGAREGIRLLQRALNRPLLCIAENCGLNGADILTQVTSAAPGYGFDARAGRFGDLFDAGVIDPVKVTCAAVQNAASVAKLILTTHTLIADKPEHSDPTAGPALGGGAEKLGRQ